MEPAFNKWSQSLKEKLSDLRVQAGATVKGVHGVEMTQLDFVNKVILNTTIYIRFAGCVATAL